MTNSLTTKELFKELDYYFSEELFKPLDYFPDTSLKNKGLKVFNGNQEELLCILETNQNNLPGYGVTWAGQSDSTLITDKSLSGEHQAIAFLYKYIKIHNDKHRMNKKGLLARISDYFKKSAGIEVVDESQVFVYKKLPKTTIQRVLLPFTLLNTALKWVVRTLFMDNIISKYTIGWLIATIANKGNPHYKTDVNTVSDTLGSLIYPGGLKKPQIDRFINLGPVLGAQFEALRDYNDYLTHQKNKAGFTEFKIKMNANVVLTGITANNKLVDVNDPNHLHIIYFNGNSGCYQQDAGMVDRYLLDYERDNKPVTSVQFNYPGVLNSSGTVGTADDLIQAGIAQVERLNKCCGVPYELIGLQGVSLGGSIASHVASYYNARGVNLAGTYASKTFSSTTNVAISYVHRVPFVGPILGLIFRPFIAFGLWATRWQLDTAAHFASLPEDKREYALVRSPKNLRVKYNPADDAVIDYYASLHRSWRLQLQRFFHQRGWFGYDSSTYKAINQGHKMSVFNKQADQYTWCPEVCGHISPKFTNSNDGVKVMHRALGVSDGVQKPTKPGLEAGYKIHKFFTDMKTRNSKESPKAQTIRNVVALLK